MPTYATKADCQNYIEGLTVDDDTAFDRLINRAERDVDSVLAAVPLDETTERKFDPTELSTGQRIALRDATCAQVEYRIEMGEDFFVRGQRDEETGPDFGHKGKLPYYAPKMARELRGAQLSGIRFARARA